MSMITVMAPVDGSQDERRAFCTEVSSILAAGNDVQFVNKAGGGINVPFLGLMAGTDGYVKSRRLGADDATRQSFVAGGYHQFYVHEIYATGTDANLGIHVRIE